MPKGRSFSRLERLRRFFLHPPRLLRGFAQRHQTKLLADLMIRKHDFRKIFSSESVQLGKPQCARQLLNHPDDLRSTLHVHRVSHEDRLSLQQFLFHGELDAAALAHHHKPDGQIRAA
jgi:hypothetical protein